MSTDFIHEVAEEREQRRRWSARGIAVSLLGPATATGGVLWALAQPYRITLLHPLHQGFWFLVIEPPLLVILVGVLFQLFIVPSLLEDLEDEDS